MSGYDVLKTLKETYEADPKTWIKGRYNNTDENDTPCGWCLMGGIFHFSNQPGDEQEASGALYNLLAEDKHVKSIVAWNDKPGRNVKQVINFLERGMENLKNGA